MELDRRSDHHPDSGAGPRPELHPDPRTWQQVEALDSTLRFARAHLGADITVQRLLILLNVYLHEGLSQGELLRLLDSTSTTALSRNLAALSAWTSKKVDGPDLVELRPDRQNLRRKRVYLTDKGRRFIDQWIREVDPAPVL